MIKRVNIEKLRELGFLNTTPLTKEVLKQEIERTIEKIDANMAYFGDKFPWCATKHNIYPIIDHSEWTEGFWTGMLWLAYEFTQEDKYKDLALKHVASFRDRLDHNIVLEHHDLGFLYTLSCVAAYKLTGDEFAKETALLAADKLLTRWQEKGEFIQAWGDFNNPSHYRFIIDCLMNLPLLYWASGVSGKKHYATIATKHFNTSMKYVIRDDASAYHTFFMNPVDGSPHKGVTHQGFSDDSSWARGQAWAIYGIPLNMRYTGNLESLEILKGVTHYFLNRLPEDHVPYWDLIFSDGSGEPRDSSSSAIAICGLDELLTLLPNLEEKAIYKGSIDTMLKSLIENYTRSNHQPGNPILYHGVYSYHSQKGVDEGNAWGDYFYLEALMRMYKKWDPYW